MSYIDIHDLPGAQRDCIVLPLTAAASMPEDYAIWHAPFNAKIRDIVVVWAASLTGDAVNYTTVTVTDKGTAGVGATTLATVNYNSGAITGFDAYALYDPATYYSVDTGTVISITLSANAGGENMPPALIFVVYEGR
jgi:hypothetical protein